MRLSLLINCADPTFCHDYAVVWLDTGQRIWVRQAGVGIDLPDEGLLRIEADVAALHARDDHDMARVTLRGLVGDARQRAWSTQGSAVWISQTRHMPIDGTWRLQAVDRTAPPSTSSREERGGPKVPPPSSMQPVQPGQPHLAWPSGVLLKGAGR